MCGAQFAISRPEPYVECPFCRQRQPVPDALLRELQSFRESFAREQGQADEAAVAVVAWKEFLSGHRPFGRSAFLILASLQVVPIAVILLLAKWLGPAFPVEPRVAILGMYVAMFGGIFLLWRLRRAGSTQRLASQQIPVRAQCGIHQIWCPTCGAPNNYDPRQTGVPCAYCRSPLFPSTRVLGQSLDAARRAKRDAVLASLRSERAGMAQLAVEMRAPATSLFAPWKPAIIGSLIVGGVLGGLTYEMLRGQIPNTPALHALWLVLPIGWAFQASRVRRERSLQARLEATLQEVALQGQGSVDGDVAHYVEWLDRYWAGPYQIPYTSLGAWFYSLRGTIGPYPSLAELNLKPADGSPSRVHLLLAAWIPGVSDTEGGAVPPALLPSIRPFQDRLLGLGCSLEVTGAGLIARMDVDLSLEGSPERFTRVPESAVLLMAIFAHLGACARHLGAM